MGKNNKDVFYFTLTDTDNESPPIEITSRFNLSRVGPNGFFAMIGFAAAFTGQINIHLGPDKDNLVHITDLDMGITSDSGPHTFDIATRSNWLKIVIISGSSFSADCVVNR